MHRLTRTALSPSPPVLAGCSTGNPQVAAYVGDSEISQSRVDEVSRVLAATSGDSTATVGDFSATVLQIIIQSTIAEKAADSLGVTISDAERDQAIATNETLTTLVNEPAATDFIKDYVEATLVVGTEAGMAAFTEQFDQTEITVNPRFGTWDAEQNALVEGTVGGSISSLAPLKQE